MDMTHLEHRLSGWLREYGEISGTPLPGGLKNFLLSRMNEVGLCETDADWITIYRDGRREIVRVMSQSGQLVTCQRSDGSYLSCTISQLKLWSSGQQLARALDYLNPEVQSVVARMGGTSGTGAIKLDKIGD